MKVSICRTSACASWVLECLKGGAVYISDIYIIGETYNYILITNNLRSARFSLGYNSNLRHVNDIFMLKVMLEMIINLK